MKRRFRAFNILATGLLLLSGLFPLSASAAYGTSDYVYDMRNVSGAQVANSAYYNGAANLALSGPWSSNTDGVAFSGNLTGSESVGQYKPATGNTINSPATAALSFGVQFTYHAPTGSACFSDSLNLTQIGRFAANAAQAKLQLTKCGTGNGDSKTQVFIQCRMAGASTPSTVQPVTSTLPLQDGSKYVAECSKSPDSGSTATVGLNVLKLDPVNGNQMTSNSFSVAALGDMSTNSYLSVGNKYPLPPPASNTDQFQSTITKVAYCGVANTAFVGDSDACVWSELPVAYWNTSAVPTASVSLNDGLTQLPSPGWTYYSVMVTNTSPTSTINNAVLVVTNPPNTEYQGNDDDTFFDSTSQTITYHLGNLAPHQVIYHRFFTDVYADMPNGTPIHATAQLTSGDTTCSNAGSTCSVSDDDTVSGSPTAVVGLTDGASQVQPNQTLNYTATVTNTSSSTISSNGTYPALTATMPNDTTFVSADGGVTPDANGNIKWNVGAIAPNQTVTKHFSVTANSDVVANEQITTSASLATVLEAVCQNAGSSCTATDTDIGLVQPAFTQWISNQSVETNITGWNTPYNTTSTVSQASGDGYDGTHSVQATNGATASAATGFDAKPRPVTTTLAGRAYTGSVWVHAQTAGQTISLILKETNSGGTTIGSKTVSVTPADTAWHQLSEVYTAGGSGDSIQFNVWSPSLPVGGYFRADLFSLTSPN